METREHSEAFAVEDGFLVRRVVPKRGTPYEHTCSKEVYENVAWAVEQFGARSFTGDDLRTAIDAPFTQVAVAMAFLKERGSIVPARGRRHQAASDFVYEDALIEYHALREKGPADPAFGYE